MEKKWQISGMEMGDRDAYPFENGGVRKFFVDIAKTVWFDIPGTADIKWNNVILEWKC